MFIIESMRDVVVVRFLTASLIGLNDDVPVDKHEESTKIKCRETKNIGVTVFT